MAQSSPGKAVLHVNILVEDVYIFAGGNFRYGNGLNFHIPALGIKFGKDGCYNGLPRCREVLFWEYEF